MILEKPEQVNATVADILSHIEPFKRITNTLIPDGGLSSNELQIVTEFVRSGARVMVQIKPDTIAFAEVGGGLDFADSRFLADDLASLERLGLIASNEWSGADGYYRLTRRAEQLVKMLPEAANASSCR